jgi:hypothetical protein
VRAKPTPLDACVCLIYMTQIDANCVREPTNLGNYANYRPTHWGEANLNTRQPSNATCRRTVENGIA